MDEGIYEGSYMGFPEDWFKKLFGWWENGDGILIHHGDADGVASAYLLYRAFWKFLGRKFSMVRAVGALDYHLPFLKEFAERFSFYLITDLDVGDSLSAIKELPPEKRVFVYDHHKIGFDLGELPENVFYCNARMLRGTEWHPASYFGYAFYRYVEEGEGGKYDPNALWLVAIGLTGDMAFYDYPELEEEVRKEYPRLFEGSPTALERIVSRINASFSHLMSHPSHLVFSLIDKAWELGDPMYFLEGEDEAVKTLQERRKEYHDIIKRAVRLMPERAVLELGYPVVHLLVEAPYVINGPLANAMVQEWPDKIALAGQKFGDIVGVEIRKGQKVEVDLAEILHSLRSRGFPFISAGGHPMAAGASLESRYWKHFVKYFKQEALIRAKVLR